METTETKEATPFDYVTFPTAVNVFFSWRKLKHFYICGETKEDKRFYVDVHVGITGKGPLGHRPGYYLHRGPDRDHDPVVGAVGYETQHEAGLYSLSADSIVVLPPYDAYNPKSTQMTVEAMVVSTTSGPDPGPGPGDDHSRRSVFSFLIEVGVKTLLREKFQWRQIKKGEGSRAELVGFKLIRMSPRSHHGGESASSADAETTETTEVTNNEEAVAILEWKNTIRWLGPMDYFSMQPFSLHFVGSGKLGQLGDRWALMTVLTALRLDYLHKMGRTNPTSIHISEKMRPI